MEERQDASYTIQREFLGEYSEEELLIRIIREHVRQEQWKEEEKIRRE